MNAMPVGIAGLASAGLRSAPEPSRDGEDGDFAAMLSPPPQQAQSQPQPQRPQAGTSATTDAARQPRRVRNETGGNARNDGRERVASDDAGEPTDETAPAPAASASDGKPAPRAAGAANDAVPTAPDSAWPPAGLATLGLLPANPGIPPASALPSGQAPDRQNVGITANALPALPIAPAATAAPVATAGAGAGKPAAPATAGAAAAAPTAFGKLLAVDGAGTSPASAAPLEARPTGSLASGDTAAAPVADAAAPPDPGALLTQGGFVHAAATVRGTDAPAFDGAPAPTPQLHDAGFDDAIGVRLSWLAEQKIGHAHIRISPDDLGPVEVRLHLDGNRIDASFSSAHAEVRQALEQGLPRLREMLGQQGFQLGNADIGQQRQGQGGDRADPAAATEGGAVDEPANVGIPAPALRPRGLLDAYA